MRFLEVAAKRHVMKKITSRTVAARHEGHQSLKETGAALQLQVKLRKTSVM